jgi:hypothetical protein
MGIEKLEPGVPRKEVDRRIHALRKEQIRNTALRFRFQMILQRYNTYQSHWQRICREIENGTYKRLLYRAEQRIGVDAKRKESISVAPTPAFPEPGAALPRDLAAELAELDKEFEPAGLPLAAGGRATQAPGLRAAQGAAKAPSSVAPPSPRAAKSRTETGAAPVSRAAGTPPTRRDEGLPEYRVRQLYVEYVETKRRQKESTASLTYEALAESLRASSARLRQKHGKAVDFEVGVKDGKAVLRPRLK